MEIEYDNFKIDCKKFIEPHLKSFGYHFDSENSEEFTNLYVNEYNILEVSMLWHFPRIEVSIDFLTLDNRRLKRSELDEFLQIENPDLTKSYKNLSQDYDMTEFENQMKVGIALTKELYNSVLTGETKIDQFDNEQYY